mmetsp:Transcript_23300/g.42122  ORF Transcript_23300/g.42122 Transcript_23300/m.42122 type:complete len:315 (-) Transcript_23300:34-978(-)
MAWTDDGSAAVKPGDSLMECKIQGAPSGSPANAYFSKPLTSGDYFEIDIVEMGDSSPFVGVTSSAAFGQGWKCKGLLFGGPGNLSNGGALVRGEFGEELRKGMKIGVLVKMDAGSITVIFYQDGRCLGPAFAARRLSDAEVYPLLHAGDGDHFCIRFPDRPAAELRRAMGGEALHPADGSWALSQLFVGPELHEFPLAVKMEGQIVKLKVTVSSPDISCSFRIVNLLNFKATSIADVSLAPFEKLEPFGPLASTMMMGPESMMEVEAKISEGLQSLHKWMAQSDSLLLVGPTIEMSFTRLHDHEDGLPASEELA